ncbi:hypothetical protein LCGC14_0527370 [marine sediment metagenome]|uniref:Uncharacterized protein n=1 Tax=marine sediment metagenome TaxID=412755 RepID=A0A0F9UI10_9ZZZZ
MKVLLCVPTFQYKKKNFTYLSMSDFPTGLAYIASALKNAGHEVIGLNLNNATKYPSPFLRIANELQQTLEREQPDLVGLGGLCTDYSFLKDAIDVIRKCSSVSIVLGGGIVNNDKEFIFNLLKPDFGIWGEGEEAIVKLVDILKTEGHPRGIDNLAYWTDDGAVFNETNYDYGNLDDRAFPDYEPFGIQGMLDDYSMSTRVLYKYSRPYPRPMTINTARSCPFNCSFCVHSGGPKYRARSIKNIMAEIKQLYKKYNFNILIIGDELFATNKKRMKDFCNALIKNKEKYGWDFDWMFQTHANAKLDRESLELAKKAGCYFFSYGIESASPIVLKSMNKKANVGQFIEAISLAKEVGIGFGGNLLFGDPAETEETIQETLDFWAKYCQQSLVFLAMVIPYPGCKIFEYSIEKGIIPDKEQYYEMIDEVNYNMTAMPNPLFGQWMQFIMRLEQTWMMAESTTAVNVIEEPQSESPMLNNGFRAYQIFAVCPHCGEDLMYRQVANKEAGLHQLGTSCHQCNKRIKIKLEAA